MRYLAALLLPAVLVAAGWCQSEDVPSLVDKLGSAKFKEREAATIALDRMGKDALPQLRAALKSSEPEQRHRAAILVQRIEQRLEIEQLLAPKKVRLSYKEVPVLDALDDFAVKAGVVINIEGDRDVLHDRRLSLETGEVTLWEAVDQLCVKAGLRECRPPGPMLRPRIELQDARPHRLPTSYIGSLRLRAVPPPSERGKEITERYPPIETPTTVGFLLEVTPEPYLSWQGVVALRITKALDEHDQDLVPAEALHTESAVESLQGRPRLWDATGKPLKAATVMAQSVARLQPGKQPARKLNEVQGTVTVELMSPRELFRVDNLDQARGKAFKADDGTILKIIEVFEKGPSLVVTVQTSNNSAADGVRVFRDADMVLNIEVQPGVGRFSLATQQGEAVAADRCETMLVEGAKRGVEVQYQLHFARPKDATDSLRLIYSVPRPVMVDVPFVLRDVPLADDPQLPPAPLGDMIILTR
jgi:hypothetical protein